MCSERTGYFIAETRANLAKLRYCRDHEIMPMVKHYKHFYDCISHSSKFNKESYNNQFNSEKYDRISLMVPKGDKDRIKTHSNSTGESANGFINRAINEAIVRDTASTEDAES